MPAVVILLQTPLPDFTVSFTAAGREGVEREGGGRVREREREREREMEREKGWREWGEIDRERVRRGREETDTLTHRQAGRQTDRQTRDREAER